MLNPNMTWRDKSWAIRTKGEKLEHVFANRDKVRLYKAGKLYVVQFSLGSDISNVKFWRYRGITEARKAYDNIVSKYNDTRIQ